MATNMLIDLDEELIASRESILEALEQQQEQDDKMDYLDTLDIMQEHPDVREELAHDWNAFGMRVHRM